MISVIVPVYNVEAYLDRCVKSILAQSYTDFELILVDDGSTDQCGSLCDMWAEKDPRIRVVHKENGGLSDARNFGIDLATGQYISFIDSEDWIAPDMLFTLYTAITSRNADMACCDFIKVADTGETSTETTRITPGTVDSCQYWKASFVNTTRTYFHVVWNKLYKREIFRTLRFPVGKYNEDILIMYDVVSMCNRIVLTDYVGYFYFQRLDSIMRSEKTIGHLDGIAGFLRWADEFAERQEWDFSVKSFQTGMHALLTNQYGEGWKQSSKYRNLRRTVFRVYRKISSSGHLSNKWRIIMFAFFVNDSLASFIYRVAMSKKYTQRKNS